MGVDHQGFHITEAGVAICGRPRPYPICPLDQRAHGFPSTTQSHGSRNFLDARTEKLCEQRFCLFP